MSPATAPTPTTFIFHGGGPCFFMDWDPIDAWDELRAALEGVIPSLPTPPRAIVVITAHWETPEVAITAQTSPDLVYDYGGFPPHTYQLTYPAPGSPALAERIGGLLGHAGIAHRYETQRGWDHGVFIPLKVMRPEADIPVLPLAFPPNWSPARLLALGQALAPLTQQGVLVYGSGSITHNLRMLFGGGPMPALLAPEIPQSAAFRTWFAERSAGADWAALADYRQQTPHAVLMHPTDEHLLPFYVAAGAAGAQPVGVRLHDSITYGCLGMDAYAFGNGAASLA